MTRLFYACFLILFCTSAIAQNTVLGEWRLHFPHAKPKHVASGDNRVIFALERDVYIIDQEDQSGQVVNKLNGLSDVDPNLVAYDSTTRSFIVCHRTGVIDIIRPDNEVVNMLAFKNKVIAGSKEINALVVKDGMAYLGISLGVLVVDLEKEEFRDTYVLGDNGSQQTVRDLAIVGDSLFALADDGLKGAELGNENIVSFTSWQRYIPAGLGELNKIEHYDGALVASDDSTIAYYKDGAWQSLLDGGQLVHELTVVDQVLYTFMENDQEAHFILRFTQDLSPLTGNIDLADLSFAGPFNSIEGMTRLDSEFYIASQRNGMFKGAEDDLQRIDINGPFSAESYNVEIWNGDVYHAEGSIKNNADVSFNPGGLDIFNGQFWLQNNLSFRSDMAEAFDVVASAQNQHNKRIYVASYIGGMYEYDPVNNQFTRFDSSNSALELSGGAYKVADIVNGIGGDIWMTNLGAEKPIVVRRENGDWESFSLPNNIRIVKNLLWDSRDLLWVSIVSGISSQDGLLVFFEDSEGQISTRVFRAGEAKGNLPNNSIREIVEDREGNIWVGTNEGIGIISCASFVFEEECNATRPVVSLDGFNQFLFETEQVNAIAVDGANRKWIGTQNGLWLISESGDEELERFTVNNSPLPSNQINDLVVHPETGELWIATAQGLASYRTDATLTTEFEKKEVVVYPNPVSTHYDGPIAIKGLSNNAETKITDVRGRLVYQGFANGGTFVWDGNDYNGQRAATGVYLVMSSDDDAREKVVSKIVFIQ